MSMKKAGIIVFSILIMLIILLLTVRGCTLSKKNNDSQVKNNVSLQTSTSEEKEVSVNKNNLEVSNKNSVNSDDFKSQDNNVDYVKSDSNDDTKNTLLEVEEPELGDVVSSDALISSKKVYIIGNSYVYSLGILIPKENEEGYNIVSYYCPKKTYSVVNVGESIKVSYQTDNKGLVSIVSISK